MSTTTTPTPIRRPRRWRVLMLALLAVGAMTGPAFLSSGPAAAEGGPPITRESPAKPVPAPADCKLIDFRTATVDPLVSPDPSTTTHTLTVTGLLPAPADVSLVPLVYVRQPEHWGIEVLACPTPGRTTSLAGDPVAPPFRLFRATFTFRGTLGTCGIEVIGATVRQTFDLAGPRGCAVFGGHS
jgi:hypothetical protein